MNLHDEAEELAMALEIGFDSVSEVVHWADAHIAALAQPPYALFDVSLASSLRGYDVAQLLRSLPGVDVCEMAELGHRRLDGIALDLRHVLELCLEETKEDRTRAGGIPSPVA